MNLGVPRKEFVKRAFVKSQMLLLAGRLVPAGAVILMYHSVQDQPEQFANSIGTGIIHATSIFRKQMEIIARQFHPVTVDEILSFLKGEQDLPRGAVAVTFDDGFADNFEVAAPILDRYGIRASFYVTASLIGTVQPPWYCRLRHTFYTSQMREWRQPLTGKIHPLGSREERRDGLSSAFDCCAPLAGREQEEMIGQIESDLKAKLASHRSDFRFMMDWDQLRRLARDGHLVGSHSMTHPNLAHVSSQELLELELGGSKRQIEEAVGSPVVHFSYPHPALMPQWTERTEAAARHVGYCSAVTTISGSVRAGANPLHLERIGAGRSENELLWRLGCAFLGRHA
jgi:peptidoglycan/xylan/chitin deacetylase (PgdA/CDA1 family)